MRLATILTGDKRPLAIALEQCGIRTESDLLFQPAIEVFRQLPPATTTLLELEEIVKQVTEAASAEGLPADALLVVEDQKTAQSPTLYSGHKNLDGLLDGFGGRRVLEFSGDQQSGKEFLALHLVLRHLSEHPNVSSLWIDTTGDFSIDLATEVLDAIGSLQASSTALDRLQVTFAPDLDAVYQALNSIEAETSGSGELNTSCVVINQVTSLLGPNLSAVSAQGHAIMTDFMRHLTYHARTYSRTLMVLNNSTVIRAKNPMVPREIHKPALGPSFAYLTDATLWLEKTDEVYAEDGGVSCTLHRATVLRSKKCLSNTKATFVIARGKLRASPPDS